jgi:hypothetical protein
MREEKRTVEGFLEFEVGRAGDMIGWYLERKKPMPGDILRTVYFFLYEDDPALLELLFEADVMRDMPLAMRGRPVFDQCCWRFRRYAKLLGEPWFIKAATTEEAGCEKE